MSLIFTFVALIAVGGFALYLVVFAIIELLDLINDEVDR